MDKTKIKTIGEQIIIALIIIVLGLLAVNQFYEWRYNNEFLQKPCNLCFKYNPELWDQLQTCFPVQVVETHPSFNASWINQHIVNVTE